MELGAMVVVINIPLDNRSPILTGPKHIKVPIWNEYASRKLNPCIRTERDLGCTIKVPKHRPLGDRAEGSVVTSPRINEFPNIVDGDWSLFSILIVRRDIDENSLANQTLIQYDVPGGLQIESIKRKHLKTLTVSCIQNHSVFVGPSTGVYEHTIGLQ